MDSLATLWRLSWFTALASLLVARAVIGLTIGAVTGRPRKVSPFDAPGD